MQRLAGVVTIGVGYLLYAGYLGGAGVWMLVSSGSIPMPGATLLPGLRLGGPYVTLSVGAAWALIGWGLLQSHNWARWTVIVMSVWAISTGLAQSIVFAPLWWPFFFVGLQILGRLAIVFYLLRRPVARQFSKSARAT